MKYTYTKPLRDKDGKFLFTKELKDNWLKALKSGEFIQHGGVLQDTENHKKQCCLGVLVTIHPDISIGRTYFSGLNSCIVNKKQVNYTPFDEMKIHTGCKVDLANNNDKSFDAGVRDYSEVIPLIKTLKTTDI